MWVAPIACDACGDNRRAGGDATSLGDSGSGAHPDAGPCWPIDTSSPGGSIEIGTGDFAFAPMPADIDLVFGSQGGFHIPTRVRMHGLQPGDVVDVTNPTNPRTRIVNFFVDTGLPTYDTACPFRLGYQDDGAGGYVQPNLIESRFFEQLGPHDLFEKQVRVVAEIIDSTGAYAKDERIVTVHAPNGWFQDAGI